MAEKLEKKKNMMKLKTSVNIEIRMWNLEEGNR